MWNKLTNLVKHRSTDIGGNENDDQHDHHDIPDASAAASGSVMSRVYEQHPNLSVFHSGSTTDITPPSPPRSPSKGSKRSMFKHSLRAKLTSTPLAPSNSGRPQADASSPASSAWTSPSPIKLIPKKLKANLHVETFAVQSSSPELAFDTAPLPVQPHTPAFPEEPPNAATTTGSIRSILRDHNTPGTGQSVRFFSRNAYHFISPNTSETEINEDANPGMGPEVFLKKLRSVSPENHTVDLMGSATQYHSVPTRPPDNVVDVFSPPRHVLSTKSRKPSPFQPRHPPRTRNMTTGSSHSSHSSASESMPGSNSQSLSSVMIPAPSDMDNLLNISQELDLADISISPTFFTPEAGDLVTSLREQLVLQQQLASQFDVDLTARDELVSLLSTQLSLAEAGAEKYRKEVERRQSAMRVLRRKVGELEKICRGLEEEVERSREESFERSIMDEASEDALVVLQGSIGQLKGELEKARGDEVKVRQECDALRSEIEAFAGERERRDNVEKDLRHAVETKSEAIQQLEDDGATATLKESQDRRTINELQAELVLKEAVIHQEHEKHALIQIVWAEEKAKLVADLETRLSTHDTREAELEDLRRELGDREEEVNMLKAEVEAQWCHAEKADEKIKGLEGEKEALVKSVQALHAKVEEVGSEWKEGEARRAELEDELNDAWVAKEEVEQERDQLIKDVNSAHEHVEQLTQSLHEHESKLNELQQERGYALDNAARLEALLRSRDAESTEAQVRIIGREEEAEQLRAQISKMKREQGRIFDDQGRRLGEMVQMEEASRKEMEAMVRQKAEDQVAFGSAKERLGILMAEAERLRRQVHDLQQESADREVQLLQLSKARVQDKEDIEGLNIALDSKQQELELLKRLFGKKGTGGSTPAPNRVGLPELASRRQSVAFATPNAPRPRTSSVDGLMKASPVVETPSKVGFSSSVRGNATSGCIVPPSAMKPTRVGSMGPPPPKRTSMNGASFSVSTSNLSRKPRSSLPVGNHRRSSSAMYPGHSVTSPVQSEEEKENVAPVKADRWPIVPA